MNVLACSPDERGKGHGTTLLSFAEQRAVASRCSGLSIIVDDANTGARRLYERCFYREVARRPIVKEGWKNPGKDWVLLLKSL